MSHKFERVFTQAFGVVGAILEKDGRFCLVRENFKGLDKWKYNQPSGWIDLGKNPIDEVKKEILEETGYIFNPTGIIGIFSLVRKDIKTSDEIFPHPIKIIFRGDIVGENKNKFEKDEISDVVWFTAEEIYAMDQNQLRDVDIKKEVELYIKGNNYPLDLITHTVQI